jgi:hypothetical protein
MALHENAERLDPEIFAIAMQDILLDPFIFKDVDRLVMVQIHDNSSTRPSGAIFFRRQNSSTTSRVRI